MSIGSWTCRVSCITKLLLKITWDVEFLGMLYGLEQGDQGECSHNSSDGNGEQH